MMVATAAGVSAPPIAISRPRGQMTCHLFPGIPGYSSPYILLLAVVEVALAAPKRLRDFAAACWHCSHTHCWLRLLSVLSCRLHQRWTIRAGSALPAWHLVSHPVFYTLNRCDSLYIVYLFPIACTALHCQLTSLCASPLLRCLAVPLRATACCFCTQRPPGRSASCTTSD